jgi:predicted dehydrogenase
VTPVAVLLIGAGLIGHRHAALIAASPEARLAGIVDPAPAAAALADNLGVPYYPSLDAVPAAGIDAAVIATPNASHAPDAIACAARGWPVLVEKPIAESAEAAGRTIAAFERAGLPLLVGHHRRHHPFVAKAREIVRSGQIGDLALVSILWALRKPDAYFGADWRRQPGAGPVLINLIHEIDLLRHICGEVVEMQSLTSTALRGFAVEDSAALLLRLDNGALATIALTDAALSPWSFEAACGENPGIAVSGAHSWRIAGTAGALEFPKLRLWRDRDGGSGDWARPLAAEEVSTVTVDPLAVQLAHFLAVVRGTEPPLVTGPDALRSLELTRSVVAGQTNTRAA